MDGLAVAAFPVPLPPPFKPFCLAQHCTCCYLCPCVANISSALLHPGVGPGEDDAAGGEEAEGQEGVEGVDWRYGSVEELDPAEWQVRCAAWGMHSRPMEGRDMRRTSFTSYAQSLML